MIYGVNEAITGMVLRRLENQGSYDILMNGFSLQSTTTPRKAYKGIESALQEKIICSIVFVPNKLRPSWPRNPPIGHGLLSWTQRKGNNSRKNAKAWFSRPLKHSLTGRGRGTRRARPREILTKSSPSIVSPRLLLYKPSLRPHAKGPTPKTKSLPRSNLFFLSCTFNIFTCFLRTPTVASLKLGSTHIRQSWPDPDGFSSLAVHQLSFVLESRRGPRPWCGRDSFPALGEDDPPPYKAVEKL
ncbi:unnamed protein product [Prunus brigantina]